MAGGIFTGANPTYVAREVAYQLKDSGATFFFVGEANLDAGLQAAKETNLPLKNVFVFDNGIQAFDGKAQSVKGVESWTKLIASPKEGAGFKWEEFSTLEQMNRCCVLNYSSGTTGLPKGVELSHYNYVANCVQVNYMAELKKDFKEWRKRARGIAFLPMYHAYGQTYSGINYPKMGVPQYLMRKFDFITMLQWIEKYKVTGLSAVPPIVVALTKRAEVNDFDLSSLEEIGSGAVSACCCGRCLCAQGFNYIQAPLAKETTTEFETRFKGNAKVKQGCKCNIDVLP
jgi:acyl-CoA synthetase (AMP-forming)/AMP-acid ligase II